MNKTLLPLVFALLFTATVVAAPKPKKELPIPEHPTPMASQPLDVKVVRAFPELRLRRPVIIANAADGSNRLFIVTQQGVIQFIPNDDKATEDDVQVYLDIEDRVEYKDRENEEGLLGMAFHPKYKQNGELFVYYTRKGTHTSVVSRFRVSKDDPNKADPASEEVLMTIDQPFWNHNGGTLAFGPDGYLYIALGDGGAANDPKKNGQNLSTLLGSILRIDVDKKSAARPYVIPQDNPFVGKKGARGEIWAYGVRNPWRIAFDRESGTLWCGEVGQNLWEEINIITRGGNYGWNKREGLHPFPPESKEPTKPAYIDPIWEYHHSIGKSITGGSVYRGKRVPKLAGLYVYADYVTGKVWALKYDEKQQKTIANYTLESENLPVITFGEDEQGEIYLSDAFGRLFRFAPAEAAATK